jgi:beta-galactosidase GanA
MGLLNALAIEDPLRAWAEIPAEVQATVRSNETERLCFLLNFTSERQTMVFREVVFDLLEEQEMQGHTEIAPYGVCLVRQGMAQG